MYGPLLKLVNDQTGRDALSVDFLQEPFLGPQVFTIPLASKRYILGGDNIFRDGASLVASKRENAGLQIRTGFQECDFEKLMDLKAKMERLCEQARLRSHRGWGPKVELQWRPEGKYYIRYADILDGDLDIPMNWLQMESPQHMVKPEDCILSLVRKPHWREDEETLENWVENPSFLLTQGGYVYEPAFGFDCWNSIGSATGGIDTINWIQGGQSAFIICPAGGGADVGIETDDIALTVDTWYYVEAWVWHRGGNRVTLRIERQTGPAWLTPVAQWTAVDIPIIDEQGKHVDAAWREPGFIRKGFVFQAPATDNYRVNIGVTAADDLGGDTQFDVDRVYLTEAVNLNWTVEGDRVLDPTDDWKEIYLMPRAWCSGRQLCSHTDHGTCQHWATVLVENHIKWFDVEDVPGNMEAENELAIEIGYATLYFDKFWAARRTRDDPFDFVDELNPVDNVFLGADTSLLADIGAPDCVMLDTTFATQAGLVERARWLLTGTALDNTLGHLRIFGLFAHPGIPTDFSARLRLRQSSTTTAVYEFVGPLKNIPGNVPVQFILVNMGLFEIPWFRGPLADLPDIEIRYYAQRNAGAFPLFCAGFFVMPADEHLVLVDALSLYDFNAGDYWKIFSTQDHFGVVGYHSTDVILGYLNYIGKPFFISPKKQNRFIFFATTEQYSADIWVAVDQPFYLKTTYVPRFL